MKTYSSMSNAKRAAKKAGYDMDETIFVKNNDGRFEVCPKIETPVAPPAPVAPAPPVEAPAKKATTRKRKERECQNGVYQPSKGKCRAVWDWCNDMEKSGGGAPTVAEVRAHADITGWNTTNAVIEYYNWRKFNGVTGRIKKG